jgi:hypothetical protein
MVARIYGNLPTIFPLEVKSFDFFVAFHWRGERADPHSRLLLAGFSTGQADLGKTKRLLDKLSFRLASNLPVV